MDPSDERATKARANAGKRLSLRASLKRCRWLLLAFALLPGVLLVGSLFRIGAVFAFLYLLAILIGAQPCARVRASLWIWPVIILISIGTCIAWMYLLFSLPFEGHTSW